MVRAVIMADMTRGHPPAGGVSKKRWVTKYHMVRTTQCVTAGVES